MSSGALTSNAFPAFVVYETITASSSTQHHIMTCNEPGPSQNLLCNYNSNGVEQFQIGAIGSMAMTSNFSEGTNVNAGRKKRRRRQKTSKNKEEAENQRMTHIAVERNRRRLMNEHLAVLRSLMPESYIQRSDQASIVGGAIDYVKELEQHLQSLEVQKRTLQQQKKTMANAENSLSNTTTYDESSTDVNNDDGEFEAPPFTKFFSYPQYTWCHTNPSEYGQSMQECLASVSVGDIEVTLIETHANVRILTARRPRQLLKIVAGLQTLRLSILHLNVTTMDAMVLYSMNLKVEEGCNLTTVDDIAAAVHHLLTLIEAESNPSSLV